MRYFTNLAAFVDCIAGALDLIDPAVNGHHRQVAYLSCKLADALELPFDEKRVLVGAALLHNIGEIVPGSSCPLPQMKREDIHKHAFLGANVLAKLPELGTISMVIAYHHVPWEQGRGRSFDGEEIPLASRIINLAGRTIAHLNSDESAAHQIDHVKSYVMQQRGSLFDPDVVDAFLPICDKEATWLDLSYPPALSEAIESVPLDAVPVTLDEAFAMTRALSRLMDFRSPFTATHSAGVAASAMKLAELSHMSSSECKMMGIAGNLHDLGKLAIPEGIIEKHGSLNRSEYGIIRSHSYYTYQILHHLEGFSEISEWAAYHHERLDGKGYPFGLDAENLSLGSRIMAVADIFTALAEDRPYRTAMSCDQVSSTLTGLARDGSISPFLCSLLIENYDAVDSERRTAVDEAVADFAALRLTNAPKA